MADDPSKSHNSTHGRYNPRGAGVSQRGRPRGRSTPSGMMRLVDSMMSPFVQCFQPSLDTCSALNMPTCGTGQYTDPVPAAAGETSTGPAMVSPAAVPSSSQEPPSTYNNYAEGAPPALSPADVLCGRGGSSHRHNVHFRDLVAANKTAYNTLTKKQKMLFSRQVVDTVHTAGGRFLAKDPSSGQWCDIGLPRSLEKASQALREKGTNNNTVILEDGEGIEATEMAAPSSFNNSRGGAPSLIIPPHLHNIYRPPQQQHFVVPLAVDPGPAWVAEFPPHPQHPADHHPVQSMPAPHRGAFPFTPRQMSRLHRQQHRSASMPAVTPTHTRSWQPPSQATFPQDTAMYHASPDNYYESPSISTAASTSSAATHSAPECHQYYRDFEPPKAPELKRQRTGDEEEREQQEEEEVVLVESDHQTTLNNSLQEGSEQLPEEVESKLSLQDRAVVMKTNKRSPSELLQGRSSARRHQHDISMAKERLNTSAEAADMAGLVALSTAASLKLDAGE